MLRIMDLKKRVLMVLLINIIKFVFNVINLIHNDTFKLIIIIHNYL